MRVAVADHRRDGRRVHHDLERGDAPRLVDARDQELRDDRHEADGELHADLALLVGREGADHAVHRGGRSCGVEGAEDEVSGLGRGDRGAHRLEVAHFAHEDDVRVLAERAADGLGEARDVGADLALRDDGLLVRVVEFDRVLDRDDVAGAVHVDEVEHRREGRRLAGAGRAGDEDEAAGLVEQLVDLLREADLLERDHLVGDLAQDEADAALLLEDGHAEAGAVLEREAEVGAAVVLDGLHLRLGADGAHQQLRVLGLEDRHVERLQVAVHAQHGRVADGEVEVGRAEVAGGLEQLVHEFGFDHGRTPSSRRPS